MKMLSILEASLLLGISRTTLRRWDKSGYLKPKYRTKGNHRRYDLEDLKHLTEPNYNKEKRYNILYSRVSSIGQKQDLLYKKKVLLNYSKNKNKLKVF